jgi:hypothetical protein
MSAASAAFCKLLYFRADTPYSVHEQLPASINSIVEPTVQIKQSQLSPAHRPACFVALSAPWPFVVRNVHRRTTQ